MALGMVVLRESFPYLQHMRTEFQVILDNKLECLPQKTKGFPLLHTEIFVFLKRPRIRNKNGIEWKKQ